MALVGYHGGRMTDPDPRRPLWVGLGLRGCRYAAQYAARRGGRVRIVDLSGLRVLDLSGIPIPDEADEDGYAALDEDLLREVLTDAGVQADRLGRGELHQRVPLLTSAIRAAGYDAVQIREWTDGVGETDSVCILPA